MYVVSRLSVNSVVCLSVVFIVNVHRALVVSVFVLLLVFGPLALRYFFAPTCLLFMLIYGVVSGGSREIFLLEVRPCFDCTVAYVWTTSVVASRRGPCLAPQGGSLGT